MSKGVRARLGDRAPWVVWGLAAGLVAVAVALAWAFEAIDVFRFAVDAVQDLGAWAGLVFLALYVAAVMLAVPATPLNFAAGLTFGLGWGTLVAMGGGVASAMAGFVVARHLAGGRLRRLVARHAAFETLAGAAKDEGFKVVLFTRLNPFLPASLKNYGFGLTDVSWQKYLAGTVLGQLPLTVFHVYLGSMGNFALFREDSTLDTGEIVILGAGLALSALLFWVLVAYSRRRIGRYTASGR